MSRVGDLVLEEHPATDRLDLVLSGSAELPATGELLTQLRNASDRARIHGAAVIRVDLTGVEFMNSTALGAFVGWIAELERMRPPLRLDLVGAPGRRWQRASLHSLASFAPTTVSVNFVEAKS